ncbi:MAG TPA: hypothetical protein VG817_04610, partial [Gemmatimonadales bacterium]|nr:hypothetical protein [Gemmatimonadales bacterium]
LGGTGALLNIVILGAIGMSIANMTHSGGISAIIARTELDTLANHLDLYHQEHGRYPATLADLARGRKRAGLPLYDHSIGLLNVTTEYAYRVEQDGLGYDLRGAGRDGITDTVDDVFPTAHGDPWKGDSTSLPETGSDD